MSKRLSPDVEVIDDDDELFADLSADQRARACADTEAYLLAYELGQRRRKRRLTRAEVARRMGVSQYRVSVIERGEITSRELATIAANAAALGGYVEFTIRVGDTIVGRRLREHDRQTWRNRLSDLAWSGTSAAPPCLHCGLRLPTLGGRFGCRASCIQATMPPTLAPTAYLSGSGRSEPCCGNAARNTQEILREGYGREA